MSSIRYIVRGLIDGSLSTLGVVLGAAISGDPLIVVSAGLGGGIANGLSNILGALSAERAGVMIKLKKSEDHMVGHNVNLKETEIYKKERKIVMRSGLYDGISTTMGAILPVAPFYLFDFTSAIYASVILTLALLFIIGIYIGKLSRENLVFAGAKMAAFGLATAAVAYALTMLF